MTDLKIKSINYHSEGVPGKIEVIPTKSCKTADELSLAYTPMDSGVAKKMINIEDYQKVLEKRLETSLKRFR